MSAFDDLLGEAYGLDQVQASRPKAVALLRKAFADDPETRNAAVARKDTATAFIAFGGRGRCHVTTVIHDLLERALAEG